MKVELPKKIVGYNSTIQKYYTKVRSEIYRNHDIKHLFQPSDVEQVISLAVARAQYHDLLADRFPDKVAEGTPPLTREDKADLDERINKLSIRLHKLSDSLYLTPSSRAKKALPTAVEEEETNPLLDGN